MRRILLLGKMHLQVTNLTFGLQKKYLGGTFYKLILYNYVVASL